MEIGFIGCGNMGGALAKRFASVGNLVMVSSRNKEHAEDCAKECGKNATAGTIADAAKFGEVVVLAVPYSQITAALKTAGDLKGKILLDVTNALTPDFSGLAVGFTSSAAEEVAKLMPQAKVVKAFNTIFAQVVANPTFRDGKPSVFVASDHADAKKKVMELASSIGFDAFDAGPLKNARLLEPLGMLNIALGYQLGMGAGIAFRLMKR